MDKIKSRLSENSTYLGLAILAYVGGKYGPEASEQLSEFVALGLGLLATVRGDKTEQG